MRLSRWSAVLFGNEVETGSALEREFRPYDRVLGRGRFYPPLRNRQMIRARHEHRR